MGKVVLDLDAALDKAGMTIEELDDALRLGEDKLNLIKAQRLSAVRLSSLAGICDLLDCTPGDVLRYIA